VDAAVAGDVVGQRAQRKGAVSFVCGVVGHSGGIRALLQIEIPNDDSSPDRIHIVSGFLCTFDALGATQQVLFKRFKFGFVFHHAKVVALKIVIGNVVHIPLVGDAVKNSQKYSVALRTW
jgi:hypothetical protein